jgi:hypothetical protein
MKRALLSLLLFSFAATAAAAPDVDALRTYALKLINRERTKANLPALRPDPALNAFADAQAARLLADTPEPLTPYMRYSFAGGSDPIRENAHSWTVSYELNDAALKDLLRKTNEAIMAEAPPLNGRRGTLLDSIATHAGIGFALDKGHFFVVQEVVRRYVSWLEPLPRKATTADTVVVAAAPIGEMTFDSIAVHHELPPTAPTMRESLPAKRKAYLPRLGTEVKRHDDGKVEYIRHVYDEGRIGEVEVTKDGRFSVKIPFTEGPGIYTVVVWLHRPGFAAPFPGGSVSIRVEESPVAAVLPVR